MAAAGHRPRDDVELEAVSRISSGLKAKLAGGFLHKMDCLPVRAGAIQERLGHSSIQITMDRYGHLLPSADAALAATLDATHAAAAEPAPAVRQLRAG
jgi:hypothetical protein